MTLQPTVLSPATPSELLLYILSCHKYPTTLVIGCSRDEFLGAAMEDVIQQLSLQDEQPDDNHDKDESIHSIHDLVKAPLYQTAISRHIRIIFTPTVTHLRAYLSVFSPEDSRLPPPPDHVPDKSPPALLVYGLLTVHRGASEWSAQGIGNSTAVLVDCAVRHRFRPIIIEPRGPGGHDDLDHLSSEMIPLLNGTLRKDNGLWSGRTVSIQHVLSRWFEFQAQEWETSQQQTRQEEHVQPNQQNVEPK